MPGTASSQIQSRSNSKARPSANVRAANLVANTPVLFRLPAIPNSPAQNLAVAIVAGTASLPAATLSSVAQSSAQATSTTAEVANEAMPDLQVSQQRTWWEHWSSGIVLIVLLIALATASILAWQGNSKSNSKLMADTKNEIELSSDLSNIEVPKFNNSKLELPVSTKSNASADKQETSSLQRSTTHREHADDLSLTPEGVLSRNLDAPATFVPAALPEPHATASLQQPVVKSQEPLFGDEGPAPTKPNISGQPASTSTQLNSPNTANPSVWDSSKSSSQPSNKPLTLDLSGTNSSGAGVTTELTINTSNRVSATLTSQATTTTNPAESSLVPANMQYAATKTATPELDQAALFASYRQYATTDMSAPAESVGNRYKSTANVGSQTPPGTATGIAAVGVGYTQPQPTQPQSTHAQYSPPANSQPAPASNNYTLQPNQNSLPNVAAQSQTTLPQYTAPASQIPQYQLPQYQNQQYQNQQYAPQNQSQPLYAPQTQPNTQYPNSVQSSNSQGLSQQYPGAQVPYNGPQAASQPNAMQLPPGPIGGYGYAPSNSPNGTAGGVPSNTSNRGTLNPGSSNPLSYPSLR